MSIAKSQENRLKFECKNCHYITCNKYDYNKHIKTIKHKINESSIKSMDLSMDLSQKTQEKIFTCQNCNKKYKEPSGLWRHKQKCNYQEENINEDDYQNIVTDKELIMLLIKENSEMKNMMMEVIKNGTHNTTNNTHMNSHNKSFNLQFFLNETCKDAMNIMDFVDSVKLQLSDLESVGKLGYVDGISNIIVKNLKALDVHKRPVHCTDSKREIMYVKDENKWEKEDENKQKMRKVIKHVTHKNTKLFKEFKEKYPGCEKSESRFSNKYDKLIVEAFGGKGDNDLEKEDKIIRNIAKNVVISNVNL